jgi:predicted transcriptional regulator
MSKVGVFCKLKNFRFQKITDKIYIFETKEKAREWQIETLQRFIKGANCETLDLFCDDLSGEEFFHIFEIVDRTGWETSDE